MPTERVQTGETYANRDGDLHIVFSALDDAIGPLEWDTRYRGSIWSSSFPDERRRFLWMVNHDPEGDGPMVGVPFPVTNYEYDYHGERGELTVF
jgi:hypothetical protein